MRGWLSGRAPGVMAPEVEGSIPSLRSNESESESPVMEKLYVVVRGDIAPGAQLAQACHVVARFAAEHREIFDAWENGARNIVVLSARDELELEQLLARAGAEALRVAEFREPDIRDERTAIALEGRASRLVSNLPLALRLRRVAA